MKYFSPIAISISGLLLAAVLGFSVMVLSHWNKTGNDTRTAGPDQTTSQSCQDLARETVTGKKRSSDQYAWPYGYDIALKNQEIQVTVALNLVPDARVNAAQLGQVKKTWEAGIEAMWNSRYAVVLPSGEAFPILVDVVFSGPDFHHDIMIRPKPGPSNALVWNMTDTPMIAAHEFGHLLGVYDEYDGGAVSPETGLVDTTSIMTSNPDKGQVYGRHFIDILNWFKIRTHDSEATLRKIGQNSLTMFSKKDEEKI